MSSWLNAHAGRSIVCEYLPDANALREHDRRFVLGLARDVTLVDIVHRRLRHAAGAETVASEWFGFHVGAHGCCLENCSGRILVKTEAATRRSIAISTTATLLVVLECPAFYVPVLMRETGQKGAKDGEGEETYT